MRRLVGFILLSCVVTTAALAQSKAVTSDSHTPDDDDSGFNNTFEKAQDLGMLGIPDASSKIPVFTFNGQLGQVPTGTSHWDSVDYLAFGLPNTNYKVHILSEENPPGSSYVELYDEKKERKSRSIGNDNEDFTLYLPGGVYFLKIATSKDLDKPPARTYNLKIESEIVPNKDTGATACAVDANSQGDGTDLKTVTGSLDGANTRDVFYFYAPWGGAFRPFRATEPDWHYDVKLRDAISGEDFLVAERGVKEEKQVIIDPGHYCVEVEQPYLKNTLNYKLSFQSNPYKLPHGTSRTNHAQLNWFDLGPLAHNGKYPGSDHSRYLNKPPLLPELEPARQYVLREWIAHDGVDHWYYFELPAPKKVRISLGGHLQPLQAEIQKQDDGAVELVATITGTSLGKALDPMGGAAMLPAGSHVLRVHYASNTGGGTPYFLEVFAEP